MSRFPLITRPSLLFGVSILALLAAPMSATAEETALKIEAVTISDMKAVIATVESSHETQARARIGGTITALYVKEGDAVTANQKLAVIGDEKLAIRGEGYEAKVKAAQSAVEKARLDFSRAQELRSTGYGTQAKLDEARNNLQQAENELKAVQSQKQEVAQQSSEGVVVAPSNGRVLRVPVALGSVIMPGETVATLSQQNYVLRVELPERHARTLHPGDTVQIGARGLQGQTLDSPETEQKTGTVRLVYPEITNGRVVADITVPELGNYFVGERTRVYIPVGQRSAIVVPKGYLFSKAGMNFVRLKNGTDVIVQIGQTTKDGVEVLSGLNSGDEVIKP